MSLSLDQFRVRPSDPPASDSASPLWRHKRTQSHPEAAAIPGRRGYLLKACGSPSAPEGWHRPPHLHRLCFTNGG
ncbi:hypothetical protein Ct61P_02787 [Colletotrichum tofieldiae]|nr:hypothetical protein Ct61P_02787 [Colletotrichum tofieldiae]